LVISLILVALIYIEINKERLVSTAIDKANESINGEIIYSTTDVSLLRSFPDLRISLSELAISSYASEDSHLLESERVYLDLNLMSVIRSSQPIEVISIRIVRPDLYLSIDQDGKSNWDLLNTANSDDGTPLNLSIADFNISDGRLTYVR